MQFRGQTNRLQKCELKKLLDGSEINYSEGSAHKGAGNYVHINFVSQAKSGSTDRNIFVSRSGFLDPDLAPA